MRCVLPGLLALTAGFSLSGAGSNSGAPPASEAPARAPAPTFTKDVVPFLAKHCYACHGNGKHRGDLSLDKYKDDEALQKDRKVWDNVLQMIRNGEMPPKERKRPDAAEVEAVLLNIEGVLANIDCTRGRNAGRVTLHRLNRVEYNNTIRDLVGVDFKPAADFPNDDVGYGRCVRRHLNGDNRISGSGTRRSAQVGIGLPSPLPSCILPTGVLDQQNSRLSTEHASRPLILLGGRAISAYTKPNCLHLANASVEVMKDRDPVPVNRRTQRAEPRLDFGDPRIAFRQSLEFQQVA